MEGSCTHDRNPTNTSHGISTSRRETFKLSSIVSGTSNCSFVGLLRSYVVNPVPRWQNPSGITESGDLDVVKTSPCRRLQRPLIRENQQALILLKSLECSHRPREILRQHSNLYGMQLTGPSVWRHSRQSVSIASSAHCCSMCHVLLVTCPDSAPAKCSKSNSSKQQWRLLSRHISQLDNQSLSISYKVVCTHKELQPSGATSIEPHTLLRAGFATTQPKLLQSRPVLTSTANLAYDIWSVPCRGIMMRSLLRQHGDAPTFRYVAASSRLAICWSISAGAS